MSTTDTVDAAAQATVSLARVLEEAAMTVPWMRWTTPAVEAAVVRALIASGAVYGAARDEISTPWSSTDVYARWVLTPSWQLTRPEADAARAIATLAIYATHAYPYITLVRRAASAVAAVPDVAWVVREPRRFELGHDDVSDALVSDAVPLPAVPDGCFCTRIDLGNPSRYVITVCAEVEVATRIAQIDKAAVALAQALPRRPHQGSTS